MICAISHTLVDPGAHGPTHALPYPAHRHASTSLVFSHCLCVSVGLLCSPNRSKPECAASNWLSHSGCPPGSKVRVAYPLANRTSHDSAIWNGVDLGQDSAISAPASFYANLRPVRWCPENECATKKKKSERYQWPLYLKRAKARDKTHTWADV